jgi:hypothetical protein
MLSFGRIIDKALVESQSLTLRPNAVHNLQNTKEVGAGQPSAGMYKKRNHEVLQKLVVLVAGFANCVCFGQGKAHFLNDSLHLVYFTTDVSSLRPADQAVAGQGVTSAATPSSVTFVADLFAGTASSALSLKATTPFSSVVGKFTPTNVILQNIPGGSPAYFEIQVRDSAYPSMQDAFANGSYGGSSGLFTMVPGFSVAYNLLTEPGPPAFSTWAPGTFDMSSQYYGLAGAMGSIMVSLIPEPSVSVLAGLCGVLLGLCRKRPVRQFKVSGP